MRSLVPGGRKVGKMKENGEKKNAVKGERILDILCLAASYGILLLLPQKAGVLLYVILGVSAFLFCVGFFRLGLTFDEPSDPKSELFVGSAYAVFGVLLNIVGVYNLHHENGSVRSIIIATLLLIEALVMYVNAGNGLKTPAHQKVCSFVFRAAAVFAVLFGAVFVIWNHFTDSSVIIAAFLLIESICLWRMNPHSNSANDLNPEIQTVPGLQTPIRQLQKDFSDVQTQLGYPWIGKIKTIKQDSVIYGPSEDGFVVYGYYLYGRFHVAGSTNPLFPAPQDAKEHITPEIPDSNGVLLGKEDLTEAYVRMFTQYAENGSAQWISDYPEQAKR